jgi:hypothetical protein
VQPGVVDRFSGLASSRPAPVGTPDWHAVAHPQAGRATAAAAARDPLPGVLPLGQRRVAPPAHGRRLAGRATARPAASAAPRPGLSRRALARPGSDLVANRASSRSGGSPFRRRSPRRRARLVPPAGRSGRTARTGTPGRCTICNTHGTRRARCPRAPGRRGRKTTPRGTPSRTPGPAAWVRTARPSPAPPGRCRGSAG